MSFLHRPANSQEPNMYSTVADYKRLQTEVNVYHTTRAWQCLHICVIDLVYGWWAIRSDKFFHYSTRL